MSDISTIPTELGVAEEWQLLNGSLWLAPESLDIRGMATTMLARGARFITITAMQLPEDEATRLDYHWDLNGELLTFTSKTADKVVPSICDLCPAADWIEREIHEYFTVDFEGHEYEPLLVREGEPVGVLVPEEDA
ncbi:MAG TPA: NADH-quinone oxidoreductase subunit C [Terriglobales bacterium]|nr:NADH-quinone oxidoreductase subunit C [Terriglobales bacterium]